MKSQERRDEEAVTISVGLLLFALVLVAGGLVLALVHRLAGVDDGVVTVLAWLVLTCAAVASVRYVYRHRRP